MNEFKCNKWLNNRIVFFLKDDLICKPYTVVDSSLVSQSKSETSGKQICLMIKHYEGGGLTPSLKQLQIGIILILKSDKIIIFTDVYNY